jgi:hypothetical protein
MFILYVTQCSANYIDMWKLCMKNNASRCQTGIVVREISPGSTYAVPIKMSSYKLKYILLLPICL